MIAFHKKKKKSFLKQVEISNCYNVGLLKCSFVERVSIIAKNSHLSAQMAVFLFLQNDHFSTLSNLII
jgi:hypothetical protein